MKQFGIRVATIVATKLAFVSKTPNDWEVLS